MLEIFKTGELVDLAIPTEDFALNSEWYDWFNRPELTRYLYWGNYKNTPERQVEFFRNLTKDRKLFIIQTKNHLPCGVISFSKINFQTKSADWAIVKDNAIEPENKRFSALESVALLIEHGFEDLGFSRINAGQHADLKGWQNRLELIGFKLEGIQEKKYIYGKETADTHSISCQYEDYLKIKKFRGGKIWDGKIKMLERANKLPKKTIRKSLENFYKNERANYYNKIFNL